MDRFVGQASLEWWANREICLEKYGIDITVAVDEVGTWQATGRHAHLLDTTQREGWDFLMEMDPHFSVVFPGEDNEENSGVLVRVFEAADGCLTLMEVPNGHGSVHITFDLT
ncbi:hypothetical protein [Streptomyces sp. NPDC088707]|uniref:hypothetical protein n=1 Tax=Streptomyces sp. NPDC088707 TaxID=3365871 RepID=UPI00381B4E2E